MHWVVVWLARKSRSLFGPVGSSLRIQPAPQGSGLSHSEWNSFLALVFASCALYGFVVALLLSGSLLLSALLAFLLSGLVMVCVVFLGGRSDSGEELEKCLPAALDMLVAQYRSSGDMVYAISQVGVSNLYPANVLFGGISAGIKSGMGYLPALSEAIGKSPVRVQRVLRLLLLSLEKGAEVSHELQRVSEDMVEERHILERKRAIVSKDVMLLGFVFCLVVPFIYALSVSLLSMFSLIENSGKAVEIPALRLLFLLSIPLHSYFISMVAGELVKGDSSKGLVYFPVVAVSALGVFFGSERALSWFYGF